ncbi:replication-relaxation family protein [Butyrivibrio hungatei]|uniref:Uncharacterized protein n=1 Tax=Butyrivibrio hungatei TaxID=185008 RepID=A0A1D9P6K5_9FIRM|nr:replication-relaxation family protein [Butyrivibrio hungatei]AOZ97944.1 hypothetical protein bhn_II145 [Butyrivibrio hungatei]
MLDTDIYVNHSSLGFSSQDELFDYLNERIGYTGNELKSAILVLCAYSFYLTQEELSFLCPLYPLYSHLSSRVIKPLIEQGYLQQEKASSFKEQEGTARVFYYITAQGYQYANSLCQGKLTTKYKKNRSKVAKSHTYYIGYNFYELLMLGYSMTWQREYLLSERSFNYKSKAPILQVDARCDLYERFGSKTFYTIYVEQDLGTEHNDVLIKKIDNYAALGIMDRPLSSMIMFSFSQKGVTDGKNGLKNQLHPYSPSNCQQLLDYMDVMHLDNVFDAYLTGYPDVSFITNFLLKCGGARPSNDGDSLKRTRQVLDRNFVSEFKRLLGERRNPYQHRDFNLIRSRFSQSRLEEMVKLLYSTSDRESPFVQRLRRGYQVYYLPTTLVSDRVVYGILDHRPDLLSQISASLESIYGNADYSGPLSAPIIVKDNIKVNLRNRFCCNKIDVYVEFPCFDIGSWIRAMYFSKYKSSDKCHLLCVFETKKQVQDFYRTLCAFNSSFDKNVHQILGLMLYDIGKEEKIFCVDESLSKNIIVTDKKEA